MNKRLRDALGSETQQHSAVTGSKPLSTRVHGSVHSHIQHTANLHPCPKPLYMSLLSLRDARVLLWFGSASLRHCHMRGVLAWKRVRPQPPSTRHHKGAPLRPLPSSRGPSLLPSSPPLLLGPRPSWASPLSGTPGLIWLLCVTFMLCRFSGPVC